MDKDADAGYDALVLNLDAHVAVAALARRRSLGPEAAGGVAALRGGGAAASRGCCGRGCGARSRRRPSGGAVPRDERERRRAGRPREPAGADMLHLDGRDCGGEEAAVATVQCLD